MGKNRSKAAVRPPSETFERYALGLARKESLKTATQSASDKDRRQSLLGEFMELGGRGIPERMTLWTRTLPSGCQPCVNGEGSNLCLTTLCNRDCFFCFNPKPRTEGMSVHGKKVESENDIVPILAEQGVRSIGLSGGEPLLDPERVIRVVGLLRQGLEKEVRVDLYTNGDLLTAELARRLRSAGVDAVRLNLAAGGYRTDAVKSALAGFEEVAVEIPAIPGHDARLRALVDELDALGASHLILHELFYSAQNLDSLQNAGCSAKEGGSKERLTWGAVAASEETVLQLMVYSLRKGHRLGLYYCSCGTQDLIAERALKRKTSPS